MSYRFPSSTPGLAARVTTHFERLKTLNDVGMLIHFRNVPELNAAFAAIDDTDVIAEFNRQSGDSEPDDVPVKVAEFQMLNKSDALIGEDAPGSKFHAETLDRDTWDPDTTTLNGPVQNLVLVHRLREVASLLGFTRLEAVSPDRDGELDLEVERAALAETITWLPTIENRGEGVFFSVSVDAVRDWLSRSEVLGRVDI